MNDLISTSRQMVPIDPAAHAAAESARARIESAYLVALRRPRNTDQARDRILFACKRPAFAEKVEYNKPVGGKAIKGPSVRFAELALKEWGNVLNDSQVVYEDEQVRRVKIFCTDLETNLTHSKEIVINKTVERKKPTPDREIIGERTNSQGDKVYIVRATDDEIQNKEAALISKALRNEGLRLIPTDIIDEGVDTARATLRDRDAKDPAAAKKKILDSFSEIGVLPRDIEQYLGHKTDSLTPAEIQDLRGIYRAIKDGEARWSDYIGGEKERDSTPLDTSAFDNLLEPLKMDENDRFMLDKFLGLVAKTNKCSVDQVKVDAAKQFETFWQKFMNWLRKQNEAKRDKPKDEVARAGTPEETTQPATQAETKPDETEKPKRGRPVGSKNLFGGQKEKPPIERVLCPDTGAEINKGYCENNCSHRQGCPAYD